MEITDVKTSLWGLSLAKQGGIVQGIDFINQCITVVLLTRKGTDPLRPEFGNEVFAQLDRPINQVKAKIINNVVNAINLWITNIRVIKVTPVISAGQVTVNVQWAFNNSIQINKVNVTYGATS